MIHEKANLSTKRSTAMTMPRRFTLVASTLTLAALSSCQFVAGIAGDVVLEGQGGSGGGQTTSSSSGMVCEPATTLVCYNGPMGTEGKGNCKAGLQTCDVQGMGYGACIGEVGPTTEDCYVTGDEDCDGIPCSENQWGYVYGDLSFQIASDVTVDKDGNVIVMGAFIGTLDIQGTKLISVGSADIFLARFKSDGTLLDAKRFGDGSHNGTVVRVITDKDSNIVAAIGLTGSADFGGGVLTSAGAEDLVVVKFDALGNYKWSKRFGDVQPQIPQGIAVNGVGDVFIGGRFTGTVNFGGVDFSAAGNQGDAFLVKLDGGTGSHLWSKEFKEVTGQPAAGQYVNDIGLDGNGDVLVAAGFNGTANFGGNDFYAPSGASDIDFAVAKYAGANGAHVWSKQLGSQSGVENVVSIAVDSLGYATIAGIFGQPIDFGVQGAPVVATPAHTLDVYVARLSSNGTAVWAKNVGPIGGSNSQPRLASDKDNNIIVSWHDVGDINFGKGAIGATGQYGALLVKLDDKGDQIWGHHYATGVDPSAGLIANVAIDPLTQSILMAGQINGTINFGKGDLTSTMMSVDVLLAKFYP